MNREFPTQDPPSGAESRPKRRQFPSDAPSRPGPDPSIKPHGSRHEEAAMNKELEAYPKCL